MRSNEITRLYHLFGDAAHVFGFFYRVELEQRHQNIVAFKRKRPNLKKNGHAYIHTVADKEQQYTLKAVIMSVLEI